MTDNIQKKPFYKNSAWIRCVIIGEEVVFGSLIIFWILFRFVSMFGYPYLVGYIHNVSIIFILHMAPMLFWQIFQETFHPGNVEALMLILVLWWIFLGVVLGNIIYRVRMYLQRKKNNP